MKVLDAAHLWLVKTGRKTRFAILRALPVFPWPIALVLILLSIGLHYLPAVPLMAVAVISGALALLFLLWIRKVLIATCLGVLSALCAFVIHVGVPQIQYYGNLALVTLLAALFLWWLVRQVITPLSTAHGVAVESDRRQRAKGVAGIFDAKERSSRTTMKLLLPVVRPSMGGVPLRSRGPEDAGYLAAYTGPKIRIPCLRQYQEAWFSIEETVLLVSPPRGGKSVYLAQLIRKARGAVLTTSTREDLAEGVHDVRSAKTVWFYNPAGYASIPNTVLWNVLVGCVDFSTATRRAKSLLPINKAADGENWDKMARQTLAVLLNAAATGEKRVEDVERWIADLGAGGNVDRAKRELSEIFAFQPSKQRIVNGFVSQPTNTRGSVAAMMGKALAWMADDTARQLGAAPLELAFDFGSFIRNGETLHCIGQAEIGPVADLLGAFVSECAHVARMMSGDNGGRLDPNLLMTIDEAAISIKVPLPEWSADFGGRGITIIAAVQSFSQLYDTWGPAAGRTLMGNVGTLIVFGGSKDEPELQKISALLGHRWQRVVRHGAWILRLIPGWQRGEMEKVPVATVADLMNLPQFTVWVLQRGLGGGFRGRIPTLMDAKVNTGAVDLTISGELQEFELLELPELQEVA